MLREKLIASIDEFEALPLPTQAINLPERNYHNLKHFGAVPILANLMTPLAPGAMNVTGMMIGLGGMITTRRTTGPGEKTAINLRIIPGTKIEASEMIA